MEWERKNDPKTTRPDILMTDLTAAIDAGSFRDRDGRVYRHQGQIFRGLSESALNNFRQLQEESFFVKLTASGKLSEHARFQVMKILCLMT